MKDKIFIKPEVLRVVLPGKRVASGRDVCAGADCLAVLPAASIV